MFGGFKNILRLERRTDNVTVEGSTPALVNLI